MAKHNGWEDGPVKNARNEGTKDGFIEAAPIVGVIVVICLFLACCVIK